MKSLGVMPRKLRCIIFILLLNEALEEVSGTPKDVLLGFIKSPPMVAIPYIVVSSNDMTASICCDICYLNKTSYAIILDQNCTCTNDLLDNLLYKCNAEKPCPGNSTESCGCTSNNYAIVYSYGTPYTYKVDVTTSSALDKVSPGFKGDVYLNIFGPDGRECREVAFFGATCAVSVSLTITVVCRDLKGFALLRLGHTNKKDGWTIDKVALTDPTTKTLYSFSKCGPIYLGNETGNGTMAEFRANSSCGFPVKGDNYFSLEQNVNMTQTVCMKGSNDQACQGGYGSPSEYVAFSRYFHKHVFPLTGLKYITKNDCDDINSTSMSNVMQSGRQGSVVGSSYVLNCTNGFFISANNTRTRTIQPICQSTGLWSVDPLPDCIAACLGKLPTLSGGASSNYTDQSASIAGDEIAVFCKTGAFEGFSETCNKLNLVCLTSGYWSLSSIPNCTTTSSSSLTNAKSNESICSTAGMHYHLHVL